MSVAYTDDRAIGRGHNAGFDFRWPEADLQCIPDWVYTSPAILGREMERIFLGRTWSYVGLECEIAKPGDYKRTYVGDKSVVVSRASDGSIHVFENRCAHRGAELCRRHNGSGLKEIVCPYHQWTYTLSGDLMAVPFRRGVAKKGGMPADFRLQDHGLRKLSVTTRRGVIFASFHDDVEPIEEYLGPEILADFDATFDGRKLKLLGYYRNLIPGNWKMYHENLKDPYHATLLHTYLVAFDLMVAGQKSAMIVDRLGRHGSLASAKGDIEAEVDKKEMRAYRSDMRLNDPRIVELKPEFTSPWSVTMMTIWPNLIVQRELNTLGTRQIVPRGPDAFELNWTMFGFEGDDEEMTRHRLRQGNLMGPSGFLGLEDNEAIKFVQDGLKRSTPTQAAIKLGGTEEGTTTHLITEAAIRSFYRYYRDVMEL